MKLVRQSRSLSLRKVLVQSDVFATFHDEFDVFLLLVLEELP